VRLKSAANGFDFGQFRQWSARARLSVGR
jgi:hypothetical protein